MINSTRYNDKVINLISEAGLPVSDLSDDNRFHYFCYGEPESPEGVIILETFVTYGLLRSLCVKAAKRRKGAGEALVAHLENCASDLGVTHLFLLTTDTADYFKRLNYSETDRKKAPEEIKNSTQFCDLCPSNSVLMMKSLIRE